MGRTDDVSQRISNASVRAKTGREWDDWFAVLDDFDCASRGHTATATFLERDHRLRAWWAQSITVRYELERGLRAPGQRARGFGLSVQRTVAASVDEAFAAWSEPAHLDRWFSSATRGEFHEGGRYSNADGDSGEYRKIVHHRLIRFTWENPRHGSGSLVTVEFTEKEADKVTVRISHEGLANRHEVEDLKTGWTWAMESFKSYVTTGQGIEYASWQAARSAH